MSGKMNSSVIVVRKGDSFSIRLQLRKNNKAVDFSGTTPSMQVRGKDDDSLLWELEAVPVDVQNGLFVFQITPEQTGLEIGDYKTDIQLKFDDGSVHTIFPADVYKTGIFRITEQVTR